MAFHDHLRAACRWLQSIQRPDGGWGRTPGEASSIVNTAEALFVLRRGALLPPATRDGLTFITSKLDSHLADPDRGKRIRYVAYGLLALAEFTDIVEGRHIERYITWLFDQRNSDGGWGHEALDGKTVLFPTAIALWALRSAGVEETRLRSSVDRVLAMAQSGGWRLHPDDEPTSVANALGLLAAGKGADAAPAVTVARQALLQTTQWGIVQDPVAGTMWSHSTAAWVLPQLVTFADTPFAPVIADGVRYVNSLQNDNGWSETPAGRDVSVRSQFWATVALDAVQNSIDAGRDVPRIDASSAQSELSEPQFVKFKVRSSWAVILPRKMYRAIVALLVMLGALILFGVHRSFCKLDDAVDSLLSIVPFAAAIIAIRRRPKVFPLGARAVTLLLIALEVIHLLLGTSVADILEDVRHFFHL